MLSEPLLSKKAENLAMQDLIRKGYVIASRIDLERILQEQKIQDRRNITDQKSAAEIGRILNVDALFIIEATSVSWGRTEKGETYLSGLAVAGRLVDSQDGLERRQKIRREINLA